MIEWWNSLDLFMKTMWAITLSASLVFVIETILTFIGAGDSDLGADGGDFDTSGGLDADISGDGSFDHDPGMNLLTFRNFINFCLGFGWSSVLLNQKIPSKGLLMIVSVIVGIILVSLVMLLFKWLNGMQQNGNINVYKSAVGCSGTAYLSIPEMRSGVGKVQISINGAIREYNAVTDGNEIKTGTFINVIDVINGNTLLVEPSNPEII